MGKKAANSYLSAITSGLAGDCTIHKFAYNGDGIDVVYGTEEYGITLKIMPKVIQNA